VNRRGPPRHPGRSAAESRDPAVQAQLGPG